MNETKSKIIIAVVLGVFTVISLALVLPSMGGETSVMNVLETINPSDPTIKFGSSEAKAVLIEYSDFECPACSYVSQNIIEPVIAKEIEGFQFVFKHFPLISIHPKAVDSAIASESAHRQGKFFEMKKILFARQDEWRNASDANQLFIEYAKELSLDIEVFENDLYSRELRDKINKAYDFGRANGLNSTPTLLLNGKKISVNSSAKLEELILAEISEN
jgi:protein-disulfide isomerase